MVLNLIPRKIQQKILISRKNKSTEYWFQNQYLLLEICPQLAVKIQQKNQQKNQRKINRSSQVLHVFWLHCGHLWAGFSLYPKAKVANVKKVFKGLNFEIPRTENWQQPIIPMVFELFSKLVRTFLHCFLGKVSDWTIWFLHCFLNDLDIDFWEWFLTMINLLGAEVRKTVHWVFGFKNDAVRLTGVAIRTTFLSLFDTKNGVGFKCSTVFFSVCTISRKSCRLQFLESFQLKCWIFKRVFESKAGQGNPADFNFWKFQVKFWVNFCWKQRWTGKPCTLKFLEVLKWHIELKHFFGRKDGQENPAGFNFWNFFN